MNDVLDAQNSISNFDFNITFSLLMKLEKQCQQSANKLLIYISSTALIFELIRGTGEKYFQILSKFISLSEAIDFRFILCLLPGIFSLLYIFYTVKILTKQRIYLTIKTIIDKYTSNIDIKTAYKETLDNYFETSNTKEEKIINIIIKNLIHFLPFLYFFINVFVTIIAYHYTSCPDDISHYPNMSVYQNGVFVWFKWYFSTSWYLCYLYYTQFVLFISSLSIGSIITFIAARKLYFCLVQKSK
jgi:hypothetical protein